LHFRTKISRTEELASDMLYNVANLREFHNFMVFDASCFFKITKTPKNSDLVLGDPLTTGLRFSVLKPILMI
jgi:hypothetical protein